MPAKMPKAPKAPKAKKVDAKKAGGKAAKKGGKKLLKKVLIILIPLLILAIVGLVLWLFVFDSGPGPKPTVEEAIDAAFIGDEEKFKSLFTEDSVEALESAWSGADIGAGATRGSWHRMMRGILTEDELKPKIVEQSVSEDGETGEVVLDIDGVKRTIHLVKVDEEWKIDVNLGIDPTLIRLPEEMMTDEIADAFEMSDPESEMWWEEREAAKEEEEAAEEGGCLGCALSAPSRGLPRGTPLVLMVGLALFASLRRRRAARIRE